jgi:septum formation inhibitor MinC
VQQSRIDEQIRQVETQLSDAAADAATAIRTAASEASDAAAATRTEASEAASDAAAVNTPLHSGFHVIA